MSILITTLISAFTIGGYLHLVGHSQEEAGSVGNADCVTDFDAKPAAFTDNPIG